MSEFTWQLVSFSLYALFTVLLVVNIVMFVILQRHLRHLKSGAMAETVEQLQSSVSYIEQTLSNQLQRAHEASRDLSRRTQEAHRLNEEIDDAMEQMGRSIKRARNMVTTLQDTEKRLADQVHPLDHADDDESSAPEDDQHDTATTATKASTQSQEPSDTTPSGADTPDASAYKIGSTPEATRNTINGKSNGTTIKAPRGLGKVRGAVREHQQER